MLTTIAPPKATAITRVKSTQRCVLLEDEVMRGDATSGAICVLGEAMKRHSYHPGNTNTIRKTGVVYRLFQLCPDRHILQEACQHRLAVIADRRGHDHAVRLQTAQFSRSQIGDN